MLPSTRGNLMVGIGSLRRSDRAFDLPGRDLSSPTCAKYFSVAAVKLPRRGRGCALSLR